jgi:hypothetical protein
LNIPQFSLPVPAGAIVYLPWQETGQAMDRFVFPKWINKLILVLPLIAAFGGLYVVVLVVFAASPSTTDVGYAPRQPVTYSHALHAGKLGLDCRYCHNTVEVAAHAAVPPTQTCMNCHKTVRAQSSKLTPVLDSYGQDRSLRWIRVHDLPQFVYFNHAAHVRRGVGCISCHGRVDKMEVVTQVERLSMGWCLECHRRPEAHLRPPERVTDMNWQPPEEQPSYGRRLRAEYNLHPSTDCGTCHR